LHGDKVFHPRGTLEPPPVSSPPMAIDFSFSPELVEIRDRVKAFVDDVIRPVNDRIERDHLRSTDKAAYLRELLDLRRQAKTAGLWLPHMSAEWGGMGLGHVELAMVQAEAARTYYGPWVFNCQAPDEGNMHTLAHWATDDQKERYLRPLCDGTVWSCFAMTEPEVAGSDPTLIRTNAYQDGDEWVINGHKWFISNAHRANFAILVARTEDDPDRPQAANTAFIIDLPSPGWTEVREIETMHGSTGHSEILIEDLRVADSQRLGGRGQGHLLGQYRLGPARLAHCMRWIAQAETALDMMVDRSLKRYSHGSLLAEKQGIQWLIADSTMELYQSKLMVLHAAYRIDQSQSDPTVDFKSEVSMAKHFVANMLNRVIDRSIQVHGALGYSTDTPLAHMYQHARWARFADGADEVHQMRIAERTIAAFSDFGSTRSATGDLPI
jgi:acyl-CoA dehydrogenase